ncbi:hypothetical protein KL928_004365 [Ogataea angusta]|uniref:MOSC domain-containing protein n=1 Tax=Pichia angusta TaxID=870730 RepID=A0AAN6I400_PICAN|nr:uncharacterized protein KL928_004365 [Ogataea angusta]KAG7816901.1 hypothetical protein KL928_004365 [Ogataea angusta]
MGHFATALSVFLSITVAVLTVDCFSLQLEQYVESYQKTWLRTSVRFLYNVCQRVTGALLWYCKVLLGMKFRGRYGGTVDYLLIYPIKAVSSGLKVDEWEVNHFGLKHDRQYVICKYDTKKACYIPILLKEVPKLSSVHVSLDNGSFKFEYDSTTTGSRAVFYLPMNVTDDYVEHHSSFGTQLKLISLWLATLEGFVLDKVLNPDFIASMGLPKEAVLVYSPNGKACKVGAPKDVDRNTLFHDYYPMLMTSQESYEEVRRNAGENGKYVRMEAFRPNLIIKDVDKPFAEDFYHKFDIVGNSRIGFTGALKCIRCTIPNIDVSKGTMDKKGTISKTMSKYRRVDEANPYKSCFGMYVIQHEKNFVIRKGDRLDVLQKRAMKMDENPFY